MVLLRTDVGSVRPMQPVPKNTTPEEPDDRQDLHNSGVDTQMAAAQLCGRPICVPGGCAPSHPVTTGPASSSRKTSHEQSRTISNLGFRRVYLGAGQQQLTVQVHAQVSMI